ncbi:MAG: aconitate hydratase AcnA [Alphaproteobacteria bacterium]|nr:aconitate hydratase AcnA [Alphaproteobacteria bacterium]MBP9877097.1 aconitate hydratase AcnA [Alphaproteobacteria bacterium]
MKTGQDTLKTKKTLSVAGKDYDYYSLKEAAKTIGDISALPYSMKILLENLLRFEDARSVKVDDIKAIASWLKTGKSDHEIAYRPARVLMQDFTGVPAVADLAAMREAVVKLGGTPDRINPLSQVDLVIDHSVMVDEFGSPTAFQMNVEREFERNHERYAFLRWGQTAFNRFRVVPPGTGICHQVNLEYLSQVVWVENDDDGRAIALPDTLVGTDSHTTMVNGLAVLGWGVGGIEAEAAMLGQPVSMVLPEVIGFELTGRLAEGVTATDLVLTVTEMLRKKGVVGKFVEFFGSGLAYLSLADRATIGNMAPEYGATCGIFPIDEETLNYLRFTGRDESRIALVEAYAKEQGMWYDAANPTKFKYTDTLKLDLSTVESSLAGPKRPQDRIALKDAAQNFTKDLDAVFKVPQDKISQTAPVAGAPYQIKQGDVVIAAITSCTNTSNPYVMVAAGLLARKAHEKGLKVKPWVKTSLAPGSQVVSDYLEKADLQKDLDALGFNLVGYGCTTCIGNSGPLPDPIANAIQENDLTVCSVLSGNRNFEGRINPHCKANYLASPPLVVAYALAGSMKVDLRKEPLGKDQKGNDVYLKDIWPSSTEISDLVMKSLSAFMFKKRYSNVFEGPDEWKSIATSTGVTYKWQNNSTYVKLPPLFEGMEREPKALQNIRKARILGLFGDSITTDHISPAGSIKKDSPAGQYLTDHKVEIRDFNSYGARRGNHEVMMRGTFANIRIKNEMMGGKEGGYTKYLPTNAEMPIYDAAMKYQQDKTPLVIFAGKEYGTGSSRDWAAKGTMLLGVKAVIAESFERIHRSNLVGMGILPLQFIDGKSRLSLGLDGSEIITIEGIDQALKPKQKIQIHIERSNGKTETVEVMSRIDTLDEVDYYRHGGILHYVLRNLTQGHNNSDGLRAVS